MSNKTNKIVLNAILQRIDDNKSFLESDNFKQMCSDIYKTGHSYTETSFFEDSEEILQSLGWTTLSADTIELFLSTLCYFEDVVTLSTNEFMEVENYSYVRNGLRIDITFDCDTILHISKDNGNE